MLSTKNSPAGHPVRSHLAGDLRLRHPDRRENHRRDSRHHAVSIPTCLRSPQRHAPIPVWSGNRQRHRLSRIGNHQLNAALHHIAITQAHYHPDAREFLQRRRADGDSKTQSIRALKRRLSDTVYRALLTDANQAAPRAA